MPYFLWDHRTMNIFLLIGHFRLKIPKYHSNVEKVIQNNQHRFEGSSPKMIRKKKCRGAPNFSSSLPKLFLMSFWAKLFDWKDYEIESNGQRSIWQVILTFHPLSSPISAQFPLLNWRMNQSVFCLRRNNRSDLSFCHHLFFSPMTSLGRKSANYKYITIQLLILLFRGILSYKFKPKKHKTHYWTPQLWTREMPNLRKGIV